MQVAIDPLEGSGANLAHLDPVRHGRPEHAPLGGIILTAAGEGIPPALFAQLRSGGRLVAPVETETGGRSLRFYQRPRAGG